MQHSTPLRTLALCIASFSWLFTNPGSAQSTAERVSLNWVRGEGAASCASSSAIASLVEDWLGPVFVPPAQASLSVEGFVRHVDAGFTAQIALTRRDGAPLGQRELRVPGEDCSGMTLQAAFVIAVTLDPEATLAALPPELEALLAQAEDPAQLLQRDLEQEAPARHSARDVLQEDSTQAAPASAASEPERTDAKRVRGMAELKPRPHVARASLGAEFVRGAGAAPVFTLSLLLTRRYLGVELSVGGTFPRRVHHRWPNSDEERAFVAGALRLRTGLCHRPFGERFRFFSCLSASGRWDYAPTVEQTPAQRDVLSAFGGGAYAVLGYALTPELGVGLELELERMLRAAYFRFVPGDDHAADVGTASLWRARLLLGGSYRF